VHLEEEVNEYRVLVEKPETKRSKHRWEDNSKMDLEEILRECVDWINLAEDKHKWAAPVKTVINLRASENMKNFLTGFTRRTDFYRAG